MAKKAVKKVVRKAKAKLKVLPRKMSSLIDIALKDIRKAEKLSNKFVIDMDVWYNPDQSLECKVNNTLVKEDKVCVMCAAGSILAFSLGGGGKSRTELVRKLEVANINQLQAVDNLRQGYVYTAAAELGLTANMSDAKISKLYDLDTEIPEYDIQDPEPFHKEMTKLKTKLVKAGL